MIASSFNFKLLIYSFLIIIAVVLAYFSNYAMVYRVTAMVLSWVAVIIGVAFITYPIFSDKAWLIRDKFLLASWCGPLIYTLNKWVIPLLLVINYLSSTHFTPYSNVRFSQDKKLPTKYDRFVILFPEITCVVIAFFLVDIAREYSVWKKLVFNFLPAVYSLIAFIILIFYLVSRRMKG